MINLGTIRPGSTILIPFNAFDSNDPSASVIVSDFALADIGIYKGTSMTERGSTTGVVLLDTDGINIDAATGIHGFSIDLSSNATAGFYSAGSHYYVTVGPITIDAATVNFVAATFNIGYPDAIINTTIASVTNQTQFILTDGPAEADVLIGCTLLFHDVASAVQLAYGYVTDYIVTTKEVICTDPVGFTFVATDNVSIFLPSNVHAVQGTTQTAGDLAALVTTADTAIDVAVADLANGTDGLGALKTLVDTVNTDLSNATDGLGALKALIDTADSVADAIKVVTDKFAFTVANQVDANALQIEGSDATDQINAACDASIETYGLDHLVSASVTGTDVADNSIIAKLVDDAATADWDGYDSTTASLEALNVDTDAIKAETALIVADTDVIDDGTSGLVKIASDVAAILVDTGTTLQAELDGIQADTEDLQTQVGTAGAGLTAVPWNAAWDAEVESEVNDALDTAISELSQGIPTATPTLRTAVMLMYMAMRNKLVVQTSGTDAIEIYNDAGTIIAKKLITDDGADYTEAEAVSGA